MHRASIHRSIPPALSLVPRGSVVMIGYSDVTTMVVMVVMVVVVMVVTVVIAVIMTI